MNFITFALNELVLKKIFSALLKLNSNIKKVKQVVQ